MVSSKKTVLELRLADVKLLINATFGKNASLKARDSVNSELATLLDETGAIDESNWVRWAQLHGRSLFPIFCVQRAIRLRCLGEKFWNRQTKRRRERFGSETWLQIEKQFHLESQRRTSYDGTSYVSSTSSMHSSSSSSLLPSEKRSDSASNRLIFPDDESVALQRHVKRITRQRETRNIADFGTFNALFSDRDSRPPKHLAPLDTVRVGSQATNDAATAEPQTTGERVRRVRRNRPRIPSTLSRKRERVHSNNLAWIVSEM